MRSMRWLPMIALLVLVACGVPIRSGSYFAQGWEPERHVTFGWQDGDDVIVGDERLAGSQFFHHRLHEAVEWELSLRGIRHTERNPDLLVHHHLSLSEHVMEYEVSDESGGSFTESQVYEGGSLVIHLEDAETGEDAWVAWGQANVEPAFTSPDAMRRWVYDMIGEMFERWPVPERR